MELIIWIALLVMASAGSYVAGRRKIEYKYPECAHVWGKWMVTHVANASGENRPVWGQKRQCEICDFTHWRRGTD